MKTSFYVRGEPIPTQLHISIGLANPTVRTRKQEVVSCSVAGSTPHTFEENIAAEKAKLEAQIATLKPGTQMDALRKKIRQLDTLSHMSDWLSSPGLQSPR